MNCFPSEVVLYLQKCEYCCFCCREDLGKLPYLTMCIKEGLRLYSAVPSIGRQLSQPLTIAGYVLPANTLIGLNIYACHHNPTVWGEDHNVSLFPPNASARHSQSLLFQHCWCLTWQTGISSTKWYLNMKWLTMIHLNLCCSYATIYIWYAKVW